MEIAVTLVAHRILMWRFWKICAPLCYVVYKSFLKVRREEDILQTDTGNHRLQFKIMLLNANVKACYKIFIILIFLIRFVKAEH
jgi:hypothetical protein